MPIETNADARRSARHTVGGGPDGPATGGRGYLMSYTNDVHRDHDSLLDCGSQMLSTPLDRADTLRQ